VCRLRRIRRLCRIASDGFYNARHKGGVLQQGALASLEALVRQCKAQAASPSSKATPVMKRRASSPVAQPKATRCKVGERRVLFPLASSLPTRRSASPKDSTESAEEQGIVEDGDHSVRATRGRPARGDKVDRANKADKAVTRAPTRHASPRFGGRTSVPAATPVALARASHEADRASAPAGRRGKPRGGSQGATGALSHARTSEKSVESTCSAPASKRRRADSTVTPPSSLVSMLSSDKHAEESGIDEGEGVKGGMLEERGIMATACRGLGGGTGHQIGRRRPGKKDGGAAAFNSDQISAGNDTSVLSAAEIVTSSCQDAFAPPSGVEMCAYACVCVCVCVLQVCISSSCRYMCSMCVCIL
jgi:hypothetical protein